MSALYEYLWALWHNWVLVMSGGPFLLDRLAKWYWVGYDAWFKERRHKIVYRLALAGILVAGFLAFSDEKSKLDHLNRNVVSTQTTSYLPYDPIPQNKLDQLTNTLRAHGNKNLVIAVDNAGDMSTTAIAEQITDAFEAAGISVSYGAGSLDSPKEVGIEFYTQQIDLPKSDSDFYRNALKILDIPITQKS